MMYRNLYVSRLLCTVCVATMVAFPFSVRAQIPGTIPFGGPVVWSMPCTCSPPLWWVIVGPPRGGVFSYALGSQAFRNYNMPLIGIWALGLYVPVGTCWFWFIICVPLPVQGTITPVVGSSLL